MRTTGIIISLLSLLLFIGCEEKEWDPNQYVEVKLDYETPFYHFKKGKFKKDNLPKEELLMGVYNEAWCTDLPALCGNYIVTDFSSFSSLEKAPSGEYEDTCGELILDKVVVFKLDDGTYALVKIVKDEFNVVEGEYCEHKISLHVNYPAFQ